MTKKADESQSSPNTFDLGLGLESTHVLITGGAGLIGQAVVSAFLACGAKVTSADISYPEAESKDKATVAGNANPNLFTVHADISSLASLDRAWSLATAHFGTVATCVALAGLDLSVLSTSESIADADPETWKRVLDINVGGTMATARCWLRGVRDHQRSSSGSATATGESPAAALRNMSLIITGSEAGHFGVRTCAIYAASKSAIQTGLLQSLRADVPRTCPGARVNAVAPGPVETTRFWDETGGPGTREWWTECQATTALAKPVPAEAVARTILFLASDTWSGNIHGQVVNVDSGKQGAVMWQPEEIK